VVEVASVVNEGGDGVGMIGEQGQDDRSEGSAQPLEASRRRDGSRAKAGQVGPQGILATQEPSHQGLGGRVLHGRGADAPQRSMQAEAVPHDASGEDPEDAGSVLASGKAEVRQQRHRPMGPWAPQPKDRDPLSGSGVREQRPAVVAAVASQRMPVLAKGAASSRFDEYRLDRRQVGFDAARARAYSLQ